MKLCTFLLLSLFAPKVFAQLDIIHYVPPLYAGTPYNDDIGNHWVVLTTPSEEAITVTIRRGDGSLVATVPNVSIASPQKYYFRNETYGNSYGTIARPNLGIVNYSGLNKVLSNQGLIFTSENSVGKNVAFYVNMRHKSRIHGFSLTSKGQAALGTSFRSGHLLSVRGANISGWRDNNPYIVDHRSHFISVMATEDNTEVTFSDIKVGNLTSRSKTALSVSDITTDVATANSVSDYTNDGIFNVILDAGQSYVIGANHKFLTPEDVNKFNGTKISSDKPIAVNTGSWCGSASTSNKQDIGVDQIVPEKLLGNQYILLKGEGIEGCENPVVVAIKDGTDVFVNGSSTRVNPETLNAGDSFAIPTSEFSSNGTMLIKASENIYMYQTTAASASAPFPTIGMNFIPPLSSLGFRQVDIPDITGLGESGIIIIYAQKGANVYINGASSPLSSPLAVTGNVEWVVYKHLVNRSYVGEVINVSVKSDKAIYVAMTVAVEPVGAAGYFSGFTKSISPINPTVEFDYDLGYVCSNIEGQFDLAINSTPAPDLYEWYEEDALLYHNQNLKIDVPTVPTKYKLKAYYRDPNMDILYNGNFAIGRGNFESDFTFSDISQLTPPGKATITSNPQSVNSRFETFTDMDGSGKMLLTHSDGLGNQVVWKKTLSNSVDIPNSLFILKVYGRLAEAGTPQYLDVYVNEKKVCDYFQLNKTGEWQSIKGYWRSGKDEDTAVIKIVDANTSGNHAVFALDSISFVPAISDSLIFNPDIVPSYSYTPYDQGLHLCKGAEQAYADIKHGEMGWFDFEWKKKNDAGDFVAITDPTIKGLDTYNLEFNNVVDAHEGLYQCTISFRSDYSQCGIEEKPIDVLVNVIVDDRAKIRSLTGNDLLCQGESTNLQVVVDGLHGRIIWSVDGIEKAEGSGFNFNDDNFYGAGEYRIKCDVENACESLSREVNIKVLAKPNLTGLAFPADIMCDQVSANLTATIDDISTDVTVDYTWYRGDKFSGDKFIETNNLSVFPILPKLEDTYYKVAVSARYDIGGVKTCSGNEKMVNLKEGDIYPKVDLTPLTPVNKCEGQAYLYNAKLATSGDYYTYLWETPAAVTLEKETPNLSLTNISPTMAGDYKVTVSNRCGSANSTSLLTLNPKLLVTGYTLSKNGPYCVNDIVTVTVNDNGNASGYIAKNLRTDELINSVTNKFTITVNNSTEGDWEITALNSCGDKKTANIPIDLADSFSVPTITNREACIGQTVTLDAKVAAPPVGTSLSFQWKNQSETDIVGENSQTLSFTNVQFADAGEYTCVVSDNLCSTQEAKGTLSVDDITSNLTPASEDVCEGLTHHFELSYVGNPPFAWFFTGADNVKKDLGISTYFYDTPLLDMDDAGLYSCEITTGCGLKVFKQTLNILTNVVVTKDPSVVLDICEGKHTTLILNVTGFYASIKWYKNDVLFEDGINRTITTEELGTSGTFEYKYIVEGSCGPVEGTFNVVVHDKPVLSALDNNVEECAGVVSLNVIESGEHNGISWWKNDLGITDGNAEPTNYVIDPATSPADDGNYIAKVSSEHCGDAQVSINLDVRNNIIVTDQSPATTTVCENEIVSLSVSADGDDIKFNWYNTTAPTVSLSDLPTLDLGSVSISAAGTYEVSLTNDLNCNNQILSFDLVVNKNPSVTNPDDKVICETVASVDFTVAGDAQGVVNYQWFNNDGKIVGATNSTYTENAPEDGQAYYCEVTGTVGICGKATSEKATLTIIQKVSVTKPLNQNIADGANAIFKVTASGEPNFSYQWEENSGSGWSSITDGGKYSGATTAELNITNADRATYNGNQYRCVVNSSGAICSSNATSNHATLIINNVLKIASHPSSTTACNGADVDLTIEGYFDALTYTWQYDDGSGYQTADNFGMSVSIVGKISTLTIPTVHTGMNSWEFRCLVSDGASTNEYSNIVTVRVLEDIATSTVDANYTPCFDAPFSLSVTTTAGDDIKYKWYKVGAETTILSTNANYNFGNIELADEGDYKCEIYNDLGCNDIIRTFNVDVLELVTLTDPSDHIMCSTDIDPIFTVGVSGDGPFNYQWFNSAGKIISATNASYTETTPVDGETYYCEVLNTCNTIVSTSALLTVTEPLSVIDPSHLTIADGADATFSVTASGEPNYTYQWQENDGGVWSNLADAGKYSGSNTASLVISNALKADFNGNEYRCIVNTDGDVCISSVTSEFATLTINSVVKIAVQADDAEICFGDNATISVKGTSDALTYTWQYDNGGGTYVSADGVASMSSAVAGKVSILTIPGNDLDINNWTFRCLVSDGVSTQEYSQLVKVRVLEDIAVTPGLLDHVLCENAALSMSVVATAGDNILYKWYKDTAPGTIVSTHSTFNIGNVLLANEGDYTCEIYNLKGCNDQIVNFTLDVQEHVSTDDPSDKIMCSTDANPVFAVLAFGDAPYFYKWFNSAGEIVGATSASYTETTPVDGESYYCEVSNTCNTVVSKSADLVVIEPLAVTKPENLAIADGGNAEFTVVASGEPNYTYQWQENSGLGFADITNDATYSGATTAILTINGADKATFDTNTYQCVVNTDGLVCIPNITSGIATLTVNDVDKILNQPHNAEVCFNDNAVLTVEGETTTLTYTWQYNNGGGYVDIIAQPGMTINTIDEISTLTVLADDLDISTWSFKCIVSDAISTDEESTDITITVLENIAVSTIDESFTPCIDSPFSLSVNTTAGDDIKFKWYKDNVIIVGATNSTYNFGNIALADEGEYKCEIYNDLHCNDITRTFNVDVLELATVVDPIDHIMCSTDADPTFVVIAGGDGPFDFQWFNSTGIIAGEKSASYTETTPVDGETYYCEVITTCNTIQSKSALLTVTEPLSVIDPSHLTIADGANATFEVVASGEPDYSYQWEENSGSGWSSITDGGKYSGATTAELKITNALEADFNGNEYRCIVNTDGVECIPSVTSGIAKLTINTIVKIAVQADDAEICFGDNATISVEGTRDALIYTWEYNDGSGTFVNADGPVSMSAAVAGKVSTLTIPGNDLDINNWTFRCLVSDALSTDEYSQIVTVKVLEDIAVTPGLLAHVLCESEALSMSVVATAGDDILYKWYKDAAPLTILSTNSTFNIGNVVLTDEGDYTCEIYNLKGCNDQTINFTLDVQEHATVSTLLDEEMCTSDVVPTFTVVAGGDAPFTYKWFNSAGEIAGAKLTSYTETAPVDGESYYCKVSNTCNTIASNVAILTVNEEVAITTQPIASSILDGADASFSVTASGEPVLIYQWQEDSGAGFNDIIDNAVYSGANSATLSITDADRATFNGNKYRCKVDNACSVEQISNEVDLTVNALIKILTPLSDLQACLNDEVYFEIVGTTPGLDYSWEYENGSGTFVNAEGVLGMSEVPTTNGSKLKIDHASLAMEAWTFRCIVKDFSSADDKSNVVSMKVFEPIAITPIDNQELCFDESKQIILDVTSGTEPYTYSWTKDATEVSATAIVNIGGADNGNYKVIASNGGVCPDKTSDFTVAHYSKLSLNAWANADHICIGTPETLSVSIDNVDPALTLSYKWYKDGVEIGGVTSADYILTAADKSNAGQYKVEVSDGCSIEFVSVYMSVYEPIKRVNNWIDQSLCVGDALLFEAQVAGDNLTYTWEVPVGVTAPVNMATFKVDAVTETQEGIYKCSVQGSCGLAVVYTASVVVDDGPNITTDLNLSAVCVGEELKLGPIAYDLTTNTTIDESIKWILPNGSTSLVTALELDLLTAEVAEEGNYRVEVSNVCGTDFSIGYQDVHPIPTLASIADQVACQGENIIFRAVTTGEVLEYRWFVNGLSQPLFDDKAELVISNIQPLDEYTLKEYTIKCIVSSCEVDLTETAKVTVSPSTILNTSIKGKVVYVGSNHDFVLDITGSHLTFEWHHINTAGLDTKIEGALTKTLSINNLSMADAGEYFCIITGDCGVRFTTAYLTVKDPLKITTGLNGLADIEKCYGEPLNLNISAKGEITSINWFKGAVDLGHHELNYSISALDITDVGSYSCVIVGEGDTVTETVKVIVYQTTVLNSALIDKTRCEAEDLSWTPDVSGSLLTYVWKTGGNIVSTEQTHSITNATLSSAGTYSVDVTGKCGRVYSEADLAIKELPRFIRHSDDLEKCENESEAIFTVIFEGDNLVYQWQKEGFDIAEANSSKLKIQNLRLSDAGEYKCVVSSLCGVVVESPIMNLVVIPQLKNLSESPSLEICDGEDAQFSIEVKGTDVVYQWQKDGINLPGKQTSQLTINPATLTDDGYYSCEISDRCTAMRYSNSRKLTVNALPNSQIFGRMTLCVMEDRVAYKTALLPDINYGWVVDGGEFTSPAEGLSTKITWGDVVEDSKVRLKILNEETGCYFEVDSLVELRALPDVNLSALESKGICESEFELAGGYPAGGIYWVNGVAQNTFDPSQGNGEYQVLYSYTDDLGCSNSTDELILKVDSLPVVKLLEDVVVGSCKATVLNVETDENNVQWYPNLYLDDPNSKTPTFTAGETTLYVAIVEDKYGCEGKDIVTVTVAPLPLITTINDTIIGECKELQFTAVISGDIEEINWSNPDDFDYPNSSNPKLVKRHVGINDYQINVTDKYGCVESASVKVEVLPNPVIGEDENLCEGETLIVDTKNLSNPIWTDNYVEWERVITKPGEYELTVEQNDCVLKQKIVMNPTPIFDLDNGDDLPGIIIFQGETYTFNPKRDLNPDFGPYFYDWSDGSVLSELEVSESNTYKLKVEDNLGCVAIDSVVLEVKPIGIESPNAFTPLSGNDNDRFYLKEINVIEKFEMYVYNRWGELMYKTNDPGYSGGWDGTYRGEDCPVGTYVWAVMLDGKMKEKGTVTLLR